MKSFLIAFAFLGPALQAHSHIEDIEISDELKFEKVYAGFDIKMILPNDSLYPLELASIKLGTALNLSLSKKVSIYSHGAIQWSSNHNSFAIAAFVLSIKLTDKLKLRVRLPLTATTFTRAHPIT